MYCGRKSVTWVLLHADIVDPDFGVRHTAVEAGLGIRLVLDVPVAPSWTTSHFYIYNVTSTKIN